MDIYHIWCNLKPGVSDLAFCEKIDGYFGHLAAEGLVAGHRIMRCKLGLAPPDLPHTRFALYRDFPDAVRESGEEKF